MSTTRIPTDLVVDGKLVVAGAVEFSDQADVDPVGMRHQHAQRYSQPNTAATTETKVVHVCQGTSGTVRKFSAGSIVVALTTATVTVDLRKNGTTILTAPITLNNANTARVAVNATLASAGAAALVAGDVLEVVITATASGGTLPTGVFTALRVDEDYVA